MASAGILLRIFALDKKLGIIYCQVSQILSR